MERKSGGIGFFGILGVVFITLKVTNQIDWSWWWVLAPLWGPVALVASIAIVGTCVVLIARKLESPGERNARELKNAFKNYSDALTRRNRN